MQNLSIDIGNTFTKIAVFDNREIIHFKRFVGFGSAELELVLKDFKIDNSIISTVDEDIEALELYLKKHTNYIRFSTNLSNGVLNKYKTPQTLGLDRWAAVLAAKNIAQATTCLVIDAGTCITYDVLEKDCSYNGGSISPGINMRFRAMHEFTGRLPLITFSSEESIPQGNTTETAMKNGVLQGVIHEIEGFIANNNKKTTALKVVLTGGDAAFLYKQLQNSIFAAQIIIEPYLVLKGLNEVIA